jgi:hypothetical protein
MSIVSMAEVAYSRDAVVRRGREMQVPRHDALPPEAGGASTSPADAISHAVKLITTYIPTEILTLYVAGLALFITQGQTEPVNYRAAWNTFWAFLMATPVVVWLVFAAKVRASREPLPLSVGKWPKWEMTAATIAFVAWAAALPQTPFSQLAWYSADVAGFLVLVVTAALGLVTPIVRS